MYVIMSQLLLISLLLISSQFAAGVRTIANPNDGSSLVRVTTTKNEHKRSLRVRVTTTKNGAYANGVF